MEKSKNGKKGKINISILIFFPHNILGHSQGVYKIFTGEKEKWTNNGNDKQEEADSLLHNSTGYTQHLYQISKS